MYRAVLIWSLLVCLALRGSALQGKAVPDPEAETPALIQRLVLDRAATIAALQRAADERERQMLAELEAKDHRLRSEIGKRQNAQAELLQVTAELQRLVDDIDARARKVAAEKAEYLKQVASIATSPDPRKRVALARYAEGDRAGALDVLVELQKAETKTVAAGWREIAALAVERKDRGEMTTTEVLPFYEKAQQLDPDDPWGWIELSRLYQEAGRLRDATLAAQRALDHAQDERARATVATEIGDVLLAAGDLQGAKALFEEGLAIGQRLAQAHPTSEQAQRDLSVSLNKLGNVLVAAGDLQAAKARFEEALAIRERLAKANPASVEAQRDLTINLNKLGDVLVAAGDLQEAEVLFEEGLAITERLAKANPTSVEAQRDLTISLDKLGDVLFIVSNLQGAKARYEESLATRQRLAKANPTSATTQRDLAISLGKLGDVLVATGDLQGARVRFEEDLAITERLAKTNPTSAMAQRDLSVSLERLGDVLVATGDLQGAKARFEENLAIAERLATANPTSPEAQRDLIVSHTKLGGLPGSESHWSEALKIALELQRTGRLAPRDAWMIDHLRRQIAELGGTEP